MGKSDTQKPGPVFFSPDCSRSASSSGISSAHTTIFRQDGLAVYVPRAETIYRQPWRMRSVCPDLFSTWKAGYKACGVREISSLNSQVMADWEWKERMFPLKVPTPWPTTARWNSGVSFAIMGKYPKFQIKRELNTSLPELPKLLSSNRRGIYYRRGYNL